MDGFEKRRWTEGPTIKDVQFIFSYGKFCPLPLAFASFWGEPCRKISITPVPLQWGQSGAPGTSNLPIPLQWGHSSLSLTNLFTSISTPILGSFSGVYLKSIRVNRRIIGYSLISHFFLGQPELWILFPLIPSLNNQNPYELSWKCFLQVCPIPEKTRFILCIGYARLPSLRKKKRQWNRKWN